MANGNIRVPPDSTGKRVDATSLDNGVDIVYRQRIAIGDNETVNNVAAVLSSGPIGSEGGLVTRNIPSGIQQVEGVIDRISATVNVAGTFTATIGMIDGISSTVQVAISTPFTINNISATVNVAGSFTLSKLDMISATVNVALAGAVTLAAGTAAIGAVSLGAGTANIGLINAISATVIVAVSTPFTINNISAAVVLAAGTANIGSINNISAAVVLAAGTANIGLINNISATVNVAFAGGISLAAGTANIGFINNISATVIVAGVVSLGAGTANIGFINGISATVIAQAGPLDFPTASHGPKCVTCSTSAAVALTAAPGANFCTYITMISCTNGSATLTRADVYAASATSSALCSMYLAASGGGFVMQYDPPIKVLSNTATNVRVKPSVSQAIFNINFYTAAG